MSLCVQTIYVRILESSCNFNSQFLLDFLPKSYHCSLKMYSILNTLILTIIRTSDISRNVTCTIAHMSSRKIRFSIMKLCRVGWRCSKKFLFGLQEVNLRVHLKVNSVYDLTSLFRACCWRRVYTTLSILRRAFLSDGLCSVRANGRAIMLSHQLTSTFTF